MLVLTRKEGETIVIDDIVITVLKVRGKAISLGIQAPPEKRISRGELMSQTSEEESVELSLHQQ